jgi:hypothetical protein
VPRGQQRRAAEEGRRNRRGRLSARTRELSEPRSWRVEEVMHEQRAGSVHHVEKLCSLYLLSHRATQITSARSSRECGGRRVGGRGGKNKERKASALGVPPSRGGWSGSKFLCSPGPATQGRSSRAPSPARPSLDLDHALLFALSFH